MIRTGIGIAISNKEAMETAIMRARDGYGLQLSFFIKEFLDNYFDDIVGRLIDEGLDSQILAIHLPMNAVSLIVEDNKFLDWLLEKSMMFSDWSMNYIIHPHKKDQKNTAENTKKAVERAFLVGIKQKLCIENFLWKRKKELRSVLEVIDFIQHWPNSRVCWDTSHTEGYYLHSRDGSNHYFHSSIVSYILKHTEVIHLSNVHLSNKQGKSKHRPFNDHEGDLPLVWLVNNLIPTYKWSGVIVLEYMKEYKHKLIENLWYLNELLEKSLKRSKNKKKKKSG